MLPLSSPVQNKFLFPEARSQGNSLAWNPRAVLANPLVTDRDLMRTEALGVFLARRTFPTLHQCSGGKMLAPGRWPAGLAQVQKFPWGNLEYLLNTNLFT